MPTNAFYNILFVSCEVFNHVHKSIILIFDFGFGSRTLKNIRVVLVDLIILMLCKPFSYVNLGVMIWPFLDMKRPLLKKPDGFKRLA